MQKLLLRLLGRRLATDEDLLGVEDRIAEPLLLSFFPSSLDSNSFNETCDGDLSIVLCEVVTWVVLVAVLLILVRELILDSTIFCTGSLAYSCMLLAEQVGTSLEMMNGSRNLLITFRLRCFGFPVSFFAFDQCE